MAQPKGITVTIKRENRKKQPWSFTIDDIGASPNMKARKRFTRKSSVERSALRALGAWDSQSNRPVTINGVPVVTRKGKVRKITFIYDMQ